MKVVLRNLNVLNAIVCGSCCWFLSSIVRVPFPTCFRDCTVPTWCFFRLSLLLKMVEVCWSNPTMPIPYSSFNFCFLSNIEIQSLMVSDAFNSLTHRALTLPKGTAAIHFSSPAHSPHYPPNGTGGRAHPGESGTVLIGLYRFQVVPICSNMFQ